MLDLEATCSSASCSTTRPPAPPTCSAARRTAQFAVVDPHVDLVDDYIALAEAQGAPIVAVFETHVQADHVSGLPELVERTGATAYLPDGRRRRVRAPSRSPTARSSSSATPRSQAIATPGPRARPPRLPGHRPHARRRAVDRADRRRAAGRRRRPPRPARPRRAHRRGDGAHAVPLADRAAARRSPTTCCSTRRTTPARSAAAGCRPTRPRRSASSAATTGRCSFDSEDAFVAALVQDIPPAPEQQAAIVAANRTGRPLAERRVSRAARPARAAREPAQFSLLVAVNAFVGAMVGLERSTLPLIGRDDFGLASSAAVLSFIVAFGLAKALTNLGAGALAAARRAPAAADRRLGGRAAGAAADRASRRAGAGSSPPTSCSASTRAWPGR